MRSFALEMNKLTLLFFLLLLPLKSLGQEFTLLFAGDAMLHQSQIDHAYRDGTYDYSGYFRHIQPEVEAADLSFVNLEVTLAGKPYKGYPCFSAPDEYAYALKDAGFDVFVTANNHILDWGKKGTMQTLQMLDSMQVKHTGVFRDAAEREEKYPLLIEKNDLRFAILNYTYGTNGITPQKPIEVNYIDEQRIRDDIRQAKTMQPDIIIALMHWGDEYKLMQNKTQERLADLLVEEGVDLVIGSHPHVVQPSKTILDEKGNISNVVVYSLGNLISGMTAKNTDGGQLVKVVLEKTLAGVRIKSAGYMLVYRHRYREAGRLIYEAVPVSLAENLDYPVLSEGAIELDYESHKKMRFFTRNAREVLNQHNEGVPEYKFRSKIPASTFGN